MKRRTWLAAPALLLAAFALPGCPRGGLTAAEAKVAVEQAALASDAETLVSGSVEVTTSFTIGGAVEAAAEEIGAFVTSQLPCAEVTVSGATVSITYGALSGSCTYRGQTYSGTHAITVSRSAPGDVLVQHAWTALSNGRVEVTGNADVTWSTEDGSRRVVHELTWTRLSSGMTATGSGDRTQSPLDGDWSTGIAIDGERAWSSDGGDWDLDIDGVEARWQDPVPQAGRYTLTTPSDDTVTLSFARLDEDTIEITLAGDERSFTYAVSRTGQIDSTGETEE